MGMQWPPQPWPWIKGHKTKILDARSRGHFPDVEAHFHFSHQFTHGIDLHQFSKQISWSAVEIMCFFASIYA
jgi:hypothetical protein